MFLYLLQVILLIYEYGIAVESSLVQRIRSNYTNDTPIADRLDRSFFGLDQDYFERMPLLVNAMQENSYIDPSVDISLNKNKPKYLSTNYTRPRPDHSKRITTSVDNRIPAIRRTSPRPFYFEYRGPTPMPFSKTYGSRSWVEGYRNTQRLRNLQQVIKYLEKTINAKFGDLYTHPTSTHIAFSGVYVEPSSKKEPNYIKTTPPPADLAVEESQHVESKKNHQPDPLYSFKPEAPGDVNLLADGFFRFSPTRSNAFLNSKETVHIPMFRPIPYRKRNYIPKSRESGENKVVNLIGSGEIEHPEATLSKKQKSFNVMLNLFPLEPTNVDFKKLEVTETSAPPLDQIYITTSSPLVQFRRRSTTPIRRTTTRIKNPRFLISKKLYIARTIPEKKANEPKMIVHVNVYPPTETTTQDPSAIGSNPYRFGTEIPILTSTQVEDFHVGSSGIIPIESRLIPAPPLPVPTLPTVTTMIPFFDTLSSSTESSVTTNQPEVIKFSQQDADKSSYSSEGFITTNQPEVFKFSQEDAKVPDQYLRLAEWASTTQPMSRRNSHHIEIKEKDDETIEQDSEDNALITKLRNKSATVTEESTTAKFEYEEETTTFRTYVPLINGHYRSVNQNSKNVNSWLNGNSESNRKRRLEMSVTGFRKPTYVPQYTEIKRNNTIKETLEDDSDYEAGSADQE